METADDKLAHLYPPFAEKVKAILKQATIETMGKHGVDHWVMVEGLRTQARQDFLYASGRTRPGDIVTRAKVSNHSSGLAADCYPANIHGAVMWDAPDEVWEQYGHCVRSQAGMQWGGDFPKIHPGSNFVDQPHAEPTLAYRKGWASKARAYLRANGLV